MKPTVSIAAFAFGSMIAATAQAQPQCSINQGNGQAVCVAVADWVLVNDGAKFRTTDGIWYHICSTENGVDHEIMGGFPDHWVQFHITDGDDNCVDSISLGPRAQ